MKTLILLLLLTTTIGIGQELDYQYFAIGSSYAKIPHTNEFTPNGIVTAGVVRNMFDVSINVEWVDLEPNYLSYFVAVNVIPITWRGVECLVGGKYGRVIRDKAAYRYFGLQGSLRYGDKLFVALSGSYDYRSDIKYWWGKEYMVFSSHLKIGIKI